MQRKTINPAVAKLRLFVTARDTGERLTKRPAMAWSEDAKGLENGIVNVYDDVEYQEIIGFGGALTESSAVTYDKLPAAVRRRILRAYFDPMHGNRYTFCRTHMNSCDFSTGNYACSETPGDVALAGFNIDRDRQSMIPFMKAAAAAAGGALKLFASPWSPPAWMKSNGQMNLGGSLLPRYRDAWALHYAKFIKAYEAAGVPLWGLTVQNEPKATQRWDSCVYTAREERDFVKRHLGPTLRREGLGDRKLMIWDHNKERLYERAGCVFEDREASAFVWGAAFHWYSGDHFEAIEAVHRRWPGKGLVFTEGTFEAHATRGSWANAEGYGHGILGDLNHFTQAWCDWNILLDEQGGPNHVGNFCEAPMRGDTAQGRLDILPSYYYIGHFSRFMAPGSRRIAVTRFTDRLECTAARTPGGEIAAVILNRGDEPIPFVLRHRGRLAPLESPAHSILTAVW